MSLNKHSFLPVWCINHQLLNIKHLVFLHTCPLAASDFSMHIPTHRMARITAFDIPAMGHWLG